MDILAFKKFYRLCQNNQLDLATWKKKQFSNVVPVLIDMHSKGPSINYVVLVGGWGVAPKTIYYIDLNLMKKKTRGEGAQKSPILRRHSLWTAPKREKK